MISAFLSSSLISFAILLHCGIVVRVVGDENESPRDHAGPCVPNNVTGKPRDWEAPDTSLSKTNGRVECTANVASGYSCENVHLESVIPLNALNPKGEYVEANDVWGWEDPTNGNEYAFIGLETGTSFVDITNPASPDVVGFLPRESGARSSYWGDAKTYKNHIFIVADSSNRSYLQVYDLTQLAKLERGSIHSLKPTVVYKEFSKAHNIVINEATGFAYVVGSNTCWGGLHMVNIANPKAPVKVGCYSNKGYTHDAQCVIYEGDDARYKNKEICFAFNEDRVDIIDVDNKNSPKHVGDVFYSGASYTHQGWLTEDHNYLIINDESDGGNTETFIADVTDLEDGVQIGTHVSDKVAIDHNLYVKGNHIYQAQYTAGFRMFGLDNVKNGELEEVGHFDIYKSHDKHTFNGAWSVYPYYKSGLVVVSGIEQGLFVLRPDLNDDGDAPTKSPVPSDVPTKSPVPSDVPTKSPVSLDAPTKSPVDAPTMSPAPTANAPTSPYLRSPSLSPSRSIDTDGPTTEDDDDDLSNLDCLKKFWHWRFNLS